MDFPDFSAHHDLHAHCHRGLTKQLIPAWLAKGVRDLDSRIESSGYGETPTKVLMEALRGLELAPKDVFLDLGAGAGNALGLARPRCSTAYGIERNPRLVELGREYLQSLAMEGVSLLEGDFLLSDWPAANKIFSATARFSKDTLKGLAHKLSAHHAASHVATLGRTIPLNQEWKQIRRQLVAVRWNSGEETLQEPLEVWARKPSVHHS